MIPKPLPKYIPGLKPERLAERKAVTIGVGITCTDGLVICADRQMTGGGFKYDETKIFRTFTKERVIIFSYAGIPDQAKAIFRKMCEGLDEDITKSGESFNIDTARDRLEKVFKDPLSKGMQALIGIAVNGSTPHLFKARERTITDPLADMIGWGDTSVTRYVWDLLCRSYFTVEQAKVIGAYIVSVAGRFVDNCGPEMDITSMANGTVHEHGVALFQNQREIFLSCEEQVGRALQQLLLSGGKKILGFVQEPKP